MNSLNPNRKVKVKSGFMSEIFTKKNLSEILFSQLVFYNAADNKIAVNF